MSTTAAEDTPVSNSIVSQEDTTTSISKVQNEESDANTDANTNISSSITAVLEAANTIRKGEENDKPTDNMNAASNNNSGDDTNNTSTPPTIEDIANSLSEPNIMTYTPDDNNEDDDNSIPNETKETNNKSAYSSQTFTAISTLMSGKDTDLLSSTTDNNNNLKPKEEGKGSKEISLEDRAHAMISVYKDYILSEEEEQKKKKKTEDTDTLESNRKEEIKVQTLKKFCNNDDDAIQYTTENDEYDSEDSGASDDSHTLLRGDKYRIEKSSVNSKKKQPKIKLKGPTSATITAAFRLKAEVALKTVKTKVKGKNNTSTTDDVDKDQDMAATIENEFDFQDYVETDIIQNEREDDLEYGITQDDDNEQLNSNNNEEEEVESGGIYGMHILDRDNSLKRRPENDDDDDDEAAVGIFNDLCDELGVTPNTHPGIHNGLHHFYHQHRSTRYKYPIFRSKKFKLGILYVTILLLILLISVAIISAITNGYENVRLKKNEPQLPDWHEEDEWREKQKEDWAHDHPSEEAAATGRFDTHPGITSKQKLFQEVSNAYQPVWYDRSSGWTGQTYSEALTWCNSHDNYIPCPYEVYCPDQKSLILSNDGLSSLMDRDGESWAPVSNANNEWVEISSKAGACDLYSERYNGEHPEWGINGDDNEEITRHILCCREHPLQEGDDSGSTNDQKANGEIQASSPPADWHIFEAASKKYKPIWFGRDKGWNGQTYQESLDFCANQMDGYMPCPLDAYCPEGRGQLIGGIQDVGESWSAVIDSANDWVQVGEGGACNLYSETEKELPSWGMTGENNEEITRHIMCCKFDPLADNSDTSQSDVSDPPLVTLPEPQHDEMGADSVNTETDDNEPISATISLTTLETRVQDKHHPVWFRSKGGSFDDAKSFCESMPSIHGKGTLHLCPLLAYCPNGPDVETKPLYLQQDAYEGVQWAPISNGDNQWVMIGDIADLTCKTYASINRHPPKWGVDGSSPQLKEHLLCCENNAINVNDNAIATIQNDSGSSVSDSGLQLGSISSTTQVDTQVEEAETSIINTFNPTWFDADTGGWTGGSHSEASKFCQQFEGSHDLPMQLCPYAAYCPHGPSHEVIGGHDANFEEEGEQWAPVFGKSNHWVMIGRKGTNKSTTCLSHEQLTGEEPTWGLDWSEKEKKRHIMCCSPLQ